MVKYYVSFGQRYAREPHPAIPSIHPDGLLEIEADNYDDARGKAFVAIGIAWSYLYSQPSIWYFPRGVTHRLIDGRIEEI
jgi:hypothetical protein